MEKERKSFGHQMTHKEQVESLIYPCYERTLYHIFKRNMRLEKFNWLMADRFFEFDYTEENEPILATHNGLKEIQGKMEETLVIKSSELETTLTEFLDQSYYAHSMLETIRPDGSKYFTSNLMESIDQGTVFLTKTNETMKETKVPISVPELLEKFPISDLGEIILNFIKVPTEFVQTIEESSRPFSYIMNEQYGYTVEKNTIFNSGKKVICDDQSLWTLYNYFLSEKETILSGEMSKKTQLRMYKHLANKIEPITTAWQEIAEYYEPNAEVLITINKITQDLETLLKWFSLLYNRPQARFLEKYLLQYQQFVSDYKEFQNQAYQLTIKLLTEGK